MAQHSNKTQRNATQKKKGGISEPPPPEPGDYHGNASGNLGTEQEAKARPTIIKPASPLATFTDKIATLNKGITLEAIGYSNAPDQPRLKAGLNVFIARTGHGKTTTLATLAGTFSRLAKQQPLLFFTLEEAAPRIAQRLISQATHHSITPEQDRLALDANEPPETYTLEEVRTILAGENYPAVKSGDLLSPQQAKENIAGKLQNIYITNAHGANATDIIKEAERFIEEHETKPHSIFIDYLSIVRPESKGHRRDIELQIIAEELRGFAEQNKIPVITAGQGRREEGKPSNQPESRTDLLKTIPHISEVREGGIEQPADIIIALTNANTLTNSEDRPEAIRDKIIFRVIKDRNGGAIGKTTDCRLDGSHSIITPDNNYTPQGNLIAWGEGGLAND